MFAFLLVLHLLIAAALVIVVLLQSGKGGGLAGAFGGGGGSQTIFGGRGAATFLSRSTAVLGAAFMLTSISLALVTTKSPAKRGKSVIEDVIRKERAEQPTQTGTQQGELPPGTLPPGRVPAGETPIGGVSQQTSPAGTQQAVTPRTGQVAPGAGVVPTKTTQGATTSQGQKKAAGTEGQTQQKKTP